MAEKRASFHTMSISLSSDLADRVRLLGFNEHLSFSSIVEHALLIMLDDIPDPEIARRLRARGASLRRP